METEAATLPLIHAGAVFHGVAELRAVDGLDGLRVQRVPEAVRAALNEKSAGRMLAPDGAEIRFLSDGDSIEVTLSCPTTACELIPFWGGFQGLERHVIGNGPTTIRLTYPERLRRLMPGTCDGAAFSPEVWRLTLRGLDKHAALQFHALRGDGLRPPAPGQVPARTCLAYGTSITEGFGATAMHLSYLAQTARRLGVSFLNLGSAGSAWCEPAMADHIAGRGGWDFAILEISLNMIGGGFTVEQYRERAGYMIDTVAGADPARPVICIGLWPYFGDVCPDPGGLHRREIAEAYRAALRDLVDRTPHRNVHFIEGSDLLRDIDGYTIDVAHPGDAGMLQIGENLAWRLEPIVAATA